MALVYTAAMARTQTEFILKDVRCFEGEQRAVLRPITLLVGENSTGKTSFLGCYRIVSQLFVRPWFGRAPGMDFNQEPFQMGSFREIVRSRRGPQGRINKFKLGLTVSPSWRTGVAPYAILFTCSEKVSEPMVSSYRMQFSKEHFLEVKRDVDGYIRINIPDYTARLDFPFMLPSTMLFELFRRRGGMWDTEGDADRINPIIRFIEGLFRKNDAQDKTRRTVGKFRFDSIITPVPKMIAIAPLRSRPKRTYNPVRESASSEGEHVPMLMMRLDRTERKEWDDLHDRLVTFGSESGLFSDIKVKRHGRRMSDPFQLQVKVRSGSHANIMDVGYGVSQSLPILVDVMGGKRTTFLLQQPEVHLHPRGQAELASFFIRSWKRKKNRFLIETHSDHIVDRLRISVRQGILKPNEVSILYFEPQGNSVKIHNLTVDKHGNLLDTPESYRDFFMQETDRLLGFSDD